MYRKALYTEHLSPSALESGPIFPWYASYLNEATPRPVGLGALWEMVGDPNVAGGNVFMYVRANAALAAGQLVSWAAPTATTVETPITVTNTQQVYVAATLTAGAEVGNWIWITPTGGTPTLRRILSNTAHLIVFSSQDYTRPTSPADFDALAVAPAGSSAIVIIRPFLVEVGVATTVPVGVALGTVTSRYYTIIQVAGLGAIQSKGDVTALVAGQPVVPGAAGVVAGSVAATANLYMGAGSIIPLAASSAASALVPCQFNFMGNV